jgi:hypothetical protein
MDEGPGPMLEEILEEVEDLAARLPAPQLARLLEERARDLPPGAPGRAAWLAHAGERWQMAGDLGRAKACLEEAVRDGGKAYLDPRAELLDVLLELDDTGRVDELLAELRRDLATGRTGGPVHPFVGETLELHGHLEEAHRWFSAGLSSRHEDRDDEIVCLNGRFRVRRQLGLPRDEYDEVCELRRREYAAELGEERETPLGGRDEQSVRLTVLYWPRAEFEALLERWPALAVDYGSEHVEHRAAVERRLRELRAQRSHVVVGVGSVTEYLGFAEGHEDNASSASTRAAYAAHLGYLGEITPWPPEPDDRCWCGSGSTYATCCGAFRFTSE